MAEQMTLAIRPEWDEIERARTICRDFLTDRRCDIDVVDAVSMVSSELIENAVKYGTYMVPILDIEFRLKVDEGVITIEVKNPVDDTAGKHLQRLDEIVQWIRGYQNPFEVYVKKLREVSAKSLLDNESCLGLVRIAYEGQSILDFYLDGNNILSVSAIFRKQ
jgi:hypothetical protein